MHFLPVVLLSCIYIFVRPHSSLSFVYTRACLPQVLICAVTVRIVTFPTLMYIHWLLLQSIHTMHASVARAKQHGSMGPHTGVVYLKSCASAEKA